MTHTEDELRAVLAGNVLEGPPDMREIVRRGRRIRRRRAVTGVVGVALAGAAIAVAAFQAQGFREGAESMEKEPPTAARVSPPTELPSQDVLDAPLIASYGSATVPGGTTLTFRPLSDYTSYRVVCADPKAVVVIRASDGSSSVGTCGEEGRHQYHYERPLTSSWSERPQRLKVWVLPGDAPIDPPAPPSPSKDDCKVVKKELGMCDGRYKMTWLTDPGVIERVIAEFERRPGRWAVGVYDRTGRPAPSRTTPMPTRTVTVGPDDRVGTATPPGPMPTRTVTVGPDDRVGTTTPSGPMPTRIVTVEP
ncbi:hypothetical protein [Streptosporangium sp. NPDC049046]|uniref:hypothetical protein n=1 Tax=Streptosporangium sp. NPDC049046 TaxID=3155031 RepID=UPI00343318B4